MHKKIVSYDGGIMIVDERLYNYVLKHGKEILREGGCKESGPRIEYHGHRLGRVKAHADDSAPVVYVK